MIGWGHARCGRQLAHRGYGIELHPEAGGTHKFCEALQLEGMLCKETHKHTIRLAPPLVVEEADLEWALERLRRVLGAKVSGSQRRERRFELFSGVAVTAQRNPTSKRRALGASESRLTLDSCSV
jgi:hypothetical protein